MTNKGRTPSVESNFWERVDQSGECWLWTGATDPNGYGRVTYQRRSQLAHRLAFQLTYGPTSAGLFVCHSCDVPACCRPEHLFAGTQRDNIRDAVAKDRLCRGVAVQNHRLTEAAAVAIRRAYIPRLVTQRILAERFGVSEGTVWAVIHGKTWVRA